MKILLISPYFPPYTGVGGLRMASLARSLLEAGDRLTVVKEDPASYPPGMAGGTQIPGIVYKEFMAGKDERETALRLQSLLSGLLQGERFDCCLVSCGPFYTIRPVSALWERIQIPLVIDYRDLWLYDPRPATTLRMFLGRSRQRLAEHPVEKKVLRICSSFVTCTPNILQIMEDHYPFIKGRSACIFNGYDLPEKSPGQSHPDESEIRIFILGKLAYYTPHGAEAFFRAAASLIKKGRPIRVIHAGAAEALEGIFSKAGFPKGRFQELGPLPYEDALAAAESAHICTAIISYAAGLGTKIFDYIYLNKPIVAYAPENSEFEALLSEAENAYVCQTSEDMEAAIEKIVTEKRYVLTNDPAYRLRFSRQAQNRKYRALLEEVSGVRAGDDGVR